MPANEHRRFLGSDGNSPQWMVDDGCTAMFATLLLKFIKLHTQVGECYGM